MKKTPKTEEKEDRASELWTKLKNKMWKVRTEVPIEWKLKTKCKEGMLLGKKWKEGDEEWQKDAQD
jgi:murein L,D-transpeptidase YafK